MYYSKNLSIFKDIFWNNPKKGYHSIGEPMFSNDLILIKEYAEILISILDDLENGQKIIPSI